MQAALKRHLDPRSLDFVFVTRDAEGLRQALTSGAPSPIAYPSPKPAEVLETDAQIARWPLPIDPKAVEITPADGFMDR